MPLKERISSVDGMRFWKDRIPFHYEYTAGVAGEKFLRGLMEGKILASECGKCGKKFLPPRAYCVDCYARATRFVEVGVRGRVAAIADSHVAFDGTRLSSPERFGFISFDGVEGGIIHRVEGKAVGVGSAVKARFRPRERRRGTISDIEAFVAAKS
jgi:uncharacterized OB-fold protein